MADTQPSHRRPRRKKPVTFRLRATIAGTDPPLYRWLDVSSELFLHDLHEVLGVSFGWVDRAHHEFRCGPSIDTPTARYISPEAVAAGDPATPENQVCLDELLTTPGDTLYYLYDFVDPWPHHLVLTELLPRTAKTPHARCAGGMRDCPANASGGIPRYEYSSRRSIWNDEDDSFDHITPEAITSDSYEAKPSPFVIEEINWHLNSVFGYGRNGK
ncbi:plasmid pRiA4b ORF-3 family protein [Nocardia sp. NPDC052001]|uniref:plasmid pRiA4b ORF-3 family protein n=1 Tax=Nocardia sp. NPDC052001 TaxID=3154853 RepID=UPI003429CC9F